MKHLWSIVFLLISSQGFCQKIVFTTADQLWAPFLTVNEKQEPQGLAPDTLKLILQDRLGMDLEIKLLPWARAQSEVKEGLSDLLITLPTRERRDYAYASDKPLWSIYLKLYTYADNPRLKEILAIKTLADIKKLGLTTVSNLGNDWHKSHVEILGIPAHYVKDDESIVRFLQNKRADIAIESPFSMGPIIKKLGLGASLLETDIKFEEVWFYLLMGKKSHLVSLWPKINQAVTATVATEAYKNLVKKAYQSVK